MAHVHTFHDPSGAQRVTTDPAECEDCNRPGRPPRTFGAFLSAERDMRARWLPTDEAMAAAKALLDAHPAADMVLVPMIQPGKQRGFWTVGQEVRTVPGVMFLAVNDDEPRGNCLAYHHARRLCYVVAGDVLAHDWHRRRDADPSRLHAPGTTSHVTITRAPDEPAGVHGAVFEDR